VLGNVETWVKRHSGKQEDWVYYKTQLRDLFKCETKEAYLKTYEESFQHWDAVFKDYYDDYIGPNVDSFGRWTLEKYNLYCPYSGLTTNHSEGFNFLLKDLNGHKEVDVDIAILSFNQLHIYYFNEIRRGFGGVGNFNLKREFCRLRTTFNVQELRKVESSLVNRLVNLQV